MSTEAYTGFKLICDHHHSAECFGFAGEGFMVVETEEKAIEHVERNTDGRVEPDGSFICAKAVWDLERDQ